MIQNGIYSHQLVSKQTDVGTLDQKIVQILILLITHVFSFVLKESGHVTSIGTMEQTL